MDATQVEARNRSDAQVRAARGSASTILTTNGALDSSGVGTGAALSAIGKSKLGQ